MKKLNILFTASEAAPFAKTGGLADVAGALPKALKKLGHDVRVVIPRYYVVDKEKYNLKPLQGALGVPMGVMGEIWCGVYEGKIPNSDVPIYFIEHEGFFGRSGLYADENNISYSDNDNRFIFLSKAALQLAKKLRFKPDIVHANDWHTAPTTLFLNTHYVWDSDFEDTASVLTIHNLQHQGKFYKGVMDVLGVGWEHFTPQELEEYDGVNLLKGGIYNCDVFNTVSRKYAKEIQTPEFGWGLDGVIRDHKDKLYGILNGVDYSEWSPDIDPHIPKNYDLDNLGGKRVCKRELQKEFGLPQRDDVPLIGFVGRLAEQKGIGLIAEIIWSLLERDVQFVLLGSGEKWAEDLFRHVSYWKKDKFACKIGYDNPLSHRIEAGSDLFLMPSLFEPCGLNQIYSLRYGTLPIVRAVGGLDDTIENYDPYTKSGTGFKFYEASGRALLSTIDWAIDTYYNDKEGMKNLIKNAMSKRFDWESSAKAYEDIYYLAKAKRKCKKYQ